MGVYTFTVYELMEQNFDFGLNEYPIFDEEYRPILNYAILNHYKYREIAYILPAQWRDRLKERMNIIMRNKYNSLYKQKQLKFNPLYNIDLTETFTHEINSNSSANSTGSSSNVTNASANDSTTTNSSNNSNGSATTSSFPNESMLTSEIADNVYVDSLGKQKNSETSSSNNSTTQETSENSSSNTRTEATNNGTTTETYTKTNKGSSAGLPFSKAMLQYKEYISKFNLDQQVIDELSDLFMTVW